MKRKFIAILMSLLIIIPTVYWGTEVDESELLAKVITKVKAQIEVPDALSEFEYYQENKIYNLDWTNPEGSKWMGITCEMDGDILEYYYREENDKNVEKPISYVQAKEVAKAFLEKAAPTYVTKLRLKEEMSPYQSNSYDFYYELVHEGVKVYHQTIQVAVDKQTGKVTHFRGISYDEKSVFENSTPKLTLEEAQKSYLSEIGLETNYKTYENEQQSEQSFLVYEVNNYKRKGISALTGKVVTFTENSRVGVMSDATTEAAMDEGFNIEAELTKAEQEAVNSRKDFLEIKTLQQNASKFFPALAQMQVEHINLYKVNENYIRDIEFTHKISSEEQVWASLSVNAITGEILSYYYDLDLAEDQTAKGEWTQKEAEAFIKEIAPKAYESLVFSELYVPKHRPYEQQYSFSRQAYDIPISGDGIELTYNTQLKQVTQYYKAWSGASFKAPENLLAKEEAVGKIGLELVYMQVSDKKYALAYNHEEASMLLDAYTGARVDYTGCVVEEEASGLYTDIKGHPSETIITNLYYSGIYLETKTLNPDDAITKEEMLSLLKKVTGQEDINLPQLLTQSEKKQTLTKEEGLCYLVGVTHYAKLAKEAELFQYPFKEKATDALKGYITVAYGLGWIGEMSTFEAQEPLTKAEAMTYIYNALPDLEN